MMKEYFLYVVVMRIQNYQPLMLIDLMILLFYYDFKEVGNYSVEAVVKLKNGEEYKSTIDIEVVPRANIVYTPTNPKANEQLETFLESIEVNLFVYIKSYYNAIIKILGS